MTEQATEPRILEIMRLGKEILDIQGKIDNSFEVKPAINLTTMEIGEGFHQVILNVDHVPRVALYNWNVSVEPLLIFGEKTYFPQLSGGDLDYFLAIVKKGLAKMQHFHASLTAC